MSNPKDGPWDDSTAHDDSAPFDSDQMEGEDPPTTRATIAQQARIRAASRAAPTAAAPGSAPRAAVSSTLPPPTSPERLPAQRTSSPVAPALSERITPVAEVAVILDNAVTRPAGATPSAGTATATGGIVVVATGSDADRVRKLCNTNGLHVPLITPIGAPPDAASMVVVGEPTLPAPPRVAHVARTALSDDALLDLLRGLLGGRVVAEPPTIASDAEPRVAELAARMASVDDRGAIENIGVEAITALVQADRARILFFDPATGALWSEAARRGAGTPDQRATAGIVGWCAYTGRAVHASPAGDDARYLTELDDPDGKAQSRLLVQPVIGADRRTHALLVAARRWRRSDFVDTDRDTLRNFAAAIATTVERATAIVPGSPPDPARRSRGTMPGVTAVRPATDPATQAALVTAPPRPASDSRPPPVTARRGDSKPPPIGPGSSSPRMSSPSTSSGDVAASAKPSADRTRAPSESEVFHHSEPRPSAAEPGRARAPSDPPRARRRSADGSDPLDVAIVATAEDDIARIKRIARKARLEVSVLARAEDAPPYYRLVTLGEAWTPDTDARVAYAARSTITDDQLAELLVGLSQDRAPAALVAAKPQTAPDAKRVQLAFASSRRLATAADLVEAETAAIAAVRELVDADRAYCLYYASDDGSLWSEARRRTRGDDRRAIAGTVGWAARTGRSVSVPRASADPRWLGPLDDPDGDMHSQLLVQPVIATDRRVIGVLVAARRTKRPPFTDLDVTVLERFAALASPLVEQLQLSSVAEQMLHDSSAPHDMPALDSPMQALLRRVRSLPRWTYAVGGAALMLAIVLIATC